MIETIRKLGDQRVKIVGTVGPASETIETIEALVEAGLDVVRLNFSHGDHAGHGRVFEGVRDAAARAGRFVAVLADLCGPKIRTGKVRGGGVPLEVGASISITPDDVLGSADRISTTLGTLSKDVHPGDTILLDDGRLALTVTAIDGAEVRCEVVRGGVLTDHKGMNIPGVLVSVPSLTERDRADLAFAKSLGVDAFALSFVRQARDVAEAKALAGDIPVIAKIEKPEAIANLGDIIEMADGVMVARGDLGVEAGAEQVPLLQKRIIAEASEKGLPVIVATQMMESMITQPTPTRAEVSDVANAVLDGADAVMLSGETAVGQYPVKTIREMSAVIAAVENSDFFSRTPKVVQVANPQFSNAIAKAVVSAAADFDISAIAVYTESGRTAALVSAYRPHASIVALSRHPEVLRWLALRWGVVPVQSEWAESSDDMVDQAVRMLLENKTVRPGDNIAIAFGLSSSGGNIQTDTLRLIRVS